MKTAKGVISDLLLRPTAVMLLLAAIGCPSALADDKPNFVFVEPAAQTLSPDSSNAFSLDVPVKNSGTQNGEASLILLSDNDKRCDQARGVDPKNKFSLLSNAIQIEHLEITNIRLPATCYLELVTSGQGGNASLKQLKLSQQYLTNAVLCPLWTCFCISGAVAVIGWIAACLMIKGVPPNFQLGSPSWDFTKSWTSNATLVGGIVSTALTLSALPELTKYASKSGYSALALLLSLIVIIAPFVFTALRRGAVGKDDATKQDIVVYQGYLIPFLISCAITLFAGLAQVVVVFLLLAEAFEGYSVWIFWPYRESWSAITLALGAAMCWYVGHSIFMTIKLQLTADQEQATRELAARTPGAGDATRNATHVKGPLLTWPVL